MNVAEAVHFEPGSNVEDLHSQLYLALLVEGEEGELTDATGLAWELPNFIHDTPERSEMQAKNCVAVLKSVVANSKPRHAIRDGSLAMEAALLRQRLCSIYCPWT